MELGEGQSGRRLAYEIKAGSHLRALGTIPHITCVAILAIPAIRARLLAAELRSYCVHALRCRSRGKTPVAPPAQDIG